MHALSSRTYISLFSGGGIGDLGFRRAGLEPLVLAEIEPRRAALAKLNFPEADVLALDISSDAEKVEEAARSRLTECDGDQLFLLSATPPCQGMSKNGIGSILKAMRDGIRPKVDPRNRLYIPVLRLVERFRPRWVFLENVCRMMNTYDIDAEGARRLVTTIITDGLRSIGYGGGFRQVELADYGLPQRRLRTAGLFGLDVPRGAPIEALLPAQTHTGNGDSRKAPWVTLRETIGHLPALDAVSRETASSSFHGLHAVPVWRPELYRWMASTPEGMSAFTNRACDQCGTVADGEEQISCDSCGALLPRPMVKGDSGFRPIKGFPSAYKRMFWDRPSSTVTTRSAYACSDHKCHPEQHRVLSMYEVALLQGLCPDSYVWGPLPPSKRSGRAAKTAPATLVRDILGEAVPPLWTELVGRTLSQWEPDALVPEPQPEQLGLFR